MTTQVARWGNSLGLRLPKSVAVEAHIAEGDTVHVTVQGGVIVITPARVQYSLEELVDKITPANRHKKTSWGHAVGREAW